MNENQKQLQAYASGSEQQMEEVLGYLYSLLDKAGQDCSLDQCKVWAANQSAEKVKIPDKKRISADEFKDIFLSYFKGRTDVYATRFTGKNGSGYMPACFNKFDNQLCPKSKFYNGSLENQKCYRCPNQRWMPLTKEILHLHFKGIVPNGKKEPVVLGIYPALENGTCYFLVFDFDAKHDDVPEEQCFEEANILESILKVLNIPYLKERSRSGKGAHIWLFFEEAIDLENARLFGDLLLKKGAESVDLPRFKTFDRMIPTQDYLEPGQIGNLVALPLQGEAVKKHNSIFVDEQWNDLKDQRESLAQTKKISKDFIVSSVKQWQNEGLLEDFNDSGQVSDEITLLGSPSQSSSKILYPEDADGPVKIIRNAELAILKDNLKPRLRSQIRRMARWNNPEYYRRKAKKESLQGIPRQLMMDEDTPEAIILPQGILEKLTDKLKKAGIDWLFDDQSNSGEDISVTFQKKLRPEQEKIIEELIPHKNGIVEAATGAGKTVLALNLVSRLQKKTLIIVSSVKVQENWVSQIHSSLKHKDGTELKDHEIGILNGKKKKLDGLIDVAVDKSLSKMDDLPQVMKKYGVVIVDECHHAAAATITGLLSQIPARYRYGFSATPSRQDELQPATEFLLGPIRTVYTAKQQASSQSFPRFYIRRKTPLILEDSSSRNFNYYVPLLCESPVRNRMILEDITHAYRKRRTILVLSSRISHVRFLYEHLKDLTDQIVLVTGSLKGSEKKEMDQKLIDLKGKRNVIIVGTSSSIGEGFDFPTLDTLFLTMPSSGDTPVKQFAGRLHRETSDKKDVLIYDYDDCKVPLLHAMYKKRCKIYDEIGYAENIEDLPERKPVFQKVFKPETVQPALAADFEQSASSVYMALADWSPKTLPDLLLMEKIPLQKGVPVKVILRETGDIHNREELVKVLQEQTDCSPETMEVINMNTLTISFYPDLKDDFLIIDRSAIWSGSVGNWTEPERLILRFEDSMMAEELLFEIQQNPGQEPNALF